MSLPNTIVHIARRNLPKKFLRQFSSEPNALIKEIGNVAVITLNRPKVHNALSENLIKELLVNFQKLENKKSIVILKGAGDKAFSSGGDIVQAANAYNKDQIKYKEMFYKFILQLNELLYLLGTYKIPTVSLINGIAFGGGAGLSFFTKYSVATENTRFSMPEVKFGFHPNVGATYFFNKNNKTLGRYLALTGHILKSTDIVEAKYATHFCRKSNLNKLEHMLTSCLNETDVRDVLERTCEKEIPSFSLAPIMGNIDKCFAENTVEGIIAKLKGDNSSWAKETLRVMQSLAPSCLKVTLKQLQKGENMNLIDCLAMESNLSLNFYNYTDVLEGTKTVLIDKTYVPKWNPPTLSEVTEELVDAYFKSVLDKEQKKILLQRQI